MSDTTYRLYWWDHDPEGWVLYREAKKIQRLRKWIRKLEARGFDRSCSILVATSDWETW